MSDDKPDLRVPSHPGPRPHDPAPDLIHSARPTSPPSHHFRPRPPRCRVQLSARLVTRTFMSELPASDTHDVIHHGGAVVAVVVPIAEYQQLRQAAEEQRINDEFDAARIDYLARQEAGTISYVSHQEAGRRLGMPA